jgi:hypothetical protein
MLNGFALAECLEGKGRFLDSLADVAWAICEEVGVRLDKLLLRAKCLRAAPVRIASGCGQPQWSTGGTCSTSAYRWASARDGAG